MGKVKRPNWTAASKCRAIANSKSPGGNVYCCIRGSRCEWKDGIRQNSAPYHREHNLAWKHLKKKHGASSKVFNEGSAIAVACPTCNLSRSNDTPVFETVSRNIALFLRLEKSCSGITRGWISRALQSYPPFLVPTVGPDVDYPAIEFWLSNQWSKRNNPKKKLFKESSSE